MADLRTDFDELPFNHPDAAGPTLAGAITERRCRRHQWKEGSEQ